MLDFVCYDVSNQGSAGQVVDFNLRQGTDQATVPFKDDNAVAASAADQLCRRTMRIGFMLE